MILFTVDYAVRFLSCPQLCHFFWVRRTEASTSPRLPLGLLPTVCSAPPQQNTMNLIDLAAVLPFWVILVLNAANPASNANGSFGFVRVIRLIRVFRVFKFGRYSIGLQMFAGALKGSVQPMGILVFVMSINMIILSSIMHIVELPEASSGDPLQDETHMRCFGTISRTFWWAMVTMTTVGYGDCTPLSGGGKVFAIVAMLSGVLILALPITVIGSNFAKMVEMFEDVRRRHAPYQPPERRLPPPARPLPHIRARTRAARAHTSPHHTRTSPAGDSVTLPAHPDPHTKTDSRPVHAHAHTRAHAHAHAHVHAHGRLQDAAMYTMTDVDGDGLVDEMELREFLAKKRKEGVLRKDIDTKVSTLMETYDPQGNGTLTMPEFLELQREVVDQTALDPGSEMHDMHSKVSQQERQLVSLNRMVNRRMTAIEDFLAHMGEHMAGKGMAPSARGPAMPRAGSSCAPAAAGVASPLPPSEQPGPPGSN